MKTRFYLIAAVFVLISLLITSTASAGGPVTGRVTVGGPDVCGHFDLSPGCDKNFALVAIQHADGSVSGQWDDRWGGGTGGFHAQVTCLAIEGDDAWIGGVVTSGVFHDPVSGEDLDLTGLAVSTMVRDNDTTAYESADQISFSFFELGPPYQPCSEKPDYPLFNAPQGQGVVVN